MPWLVERQLRAAWQPDRGEQSPALITDGSRRLDTLGRELVERGPDVVTHQVELVLGLIVGRMRGDLGRRQLEDEPAVTRVHAGEAEHVPEERPIALSVSGVDDHMST